MQRHHHSPAEVRLRELLREKRQQRGLTQLALSRVLDGSRAFVAKYESGERFLTFTEVVLICKYLGIDPADIAEEIAAHTEDVGILEPQPSKVGRPRKNPLPASEVDCEVAAR